MNECDIPGCTGSDSLPFTCNECGGRYCSDHRLPEKHLCSQLRTTDQGLEDLFSTGLQDKEVKKRGLTKRTSETNPPPKPTESPTGSPDKSDYSETNQTQRTDEQRFDVLRRLSSTIPQVAWKKANRIHNQLYELLWSHWISARHRLKTLIRIAGIVFVLVGGIRLLASSPINTQLVSWIQEIGEYLQIFPKFGGVTYIFVGLIVFYLANFRLYSLIKVGAAAVVVSVLLVGFTPVALSNGTPDFIREPVQDSAEVVSGAVGDIISELTEESTSTGDGSAGSGLDRVRIEQIIHQKINERRQERGLRNLAFDTELEDIARYHSEDMAKEDYFDHTSPDGESMADRYERFGYNCQVSTGGNTYVTGAENINRIEYTGFEYSNSEIAEDFVSSWMSSPGHRENILRPYWENEGIGVFIEETDGSTEIFVTQNFC